MKDFIQHFVEDLQTVVVMKEGCIPYTDEPAESVPPASCYNQRRKFELKEGHCHDCGFVHHGDRCPAADKDCSKCKQRGHFKRIYVENVKDQSAW